MTIFEWCMYYLSFAPLWVSILFLNLMSILHGTHHTCTEYINFVAIPIGFVISLYFTYKNLIPTKMNSQKYILKSVSEEKLATAEFLATFIIPLFVFDFTYWESMLLFVFYFLVFGYLCVRHNYFCTNIVLDLLGYRVYDCMLLYGDDIRVLTKILSKRNLKLSEGDSIYIKGLNNDYSYDCFQKGDEDT